MNKANKETKKAGSSLFKAAIKTAQYAVEENYADKKKEERAREDKKHFDGLVKKEKERKALEAKEKQLQSDEDEMYGKASTPEKKTESPSLF